MKKINAFLTLSFIPGLFGCSMVPRMEAGKSYIDSGRIIQRISQTNCRFLIATDNYGTYETETCDKDECSEYLPGAHIRVEIHSQGIIRIIGRATP